MTPKRLTPAAEELVSLAGTVSSSFAEASEKVLPKMAVTMKLSESSVQRTSESAGHRLGRVAEREEGARRSDAVKCWHKDARGKTMRSCGP